MPVWPLEATAWAEARGLSPAHPGDWSEAAVDAFIRWKLARFRATWRAYRADGTVDAYRKSSRSGLIQAVRTDLQDAMTRPPTQTVRVCPCHPRNPAHLPRAARTAALLEPWDRVSDEEAQAWRDVDGFFRDIMRERTARCLAYLERFNPSVTA